MDWHVQSKQYQNQLSYLHKRVKMKNDNPEE